MSRKKKILISISVFVISILIIGFIYIDNIIEGAINKELEYQIELHKNEYIIEVGKVKSTLILNRLTIEEVTIKEIHNEKKGSIRKFEFSLDKFVLKLHDLSEMFSDGKLLIKEIDINEPELIINLALNEFKKKIKQKKTGSTLFSSIHVENININEGSLKLNQLDSAGVEVNIALVDKFDLNIISSELYLDSSKVGTKYNYEEFELDLSGIDIHNINQRFLKVGTINYNSNAGIFSVNNIQFENSESLVDFKQSAQNNAPWINLNASGVKFEIPVNQLFDKNIKLDLLEINKSSFEFYQDNTLPMISRNKLTYAEILKKIKLPLTIDTIRLLSSNANIQVRSKTQKKEDTISVKNVNADILFVSTDSVYQKDHPQVEMELQSLLWENTPTELHVKFDVDSTSDRFEGDLKMGALSYTKIKHVLEERIDLDLFSGEIKHFNFNFLHFKNNFSGDTDLLIHNVHVNPKELIFPDETKNINFSLNELRLMANFNRNLGASGILIVDTLMVKKPVVSLTKVERRNFAKPSGVKVKARDVLFKTYQINYVNIDDLAIKVYNNEGHHLPIFSIDNGWIKSNNIQVRTDNMGIIDFRPLDLTFGINKLKYNNSTRNFLEISRIRYYKQRGQLDISGIGFKSEGSKFDFLLRKSKEKFWMGLDVEKASVDFDILKVTKGEYQLSKIKIDNPIITFINDPSDPKTNKGKEKETDIKKNDLLYLINEIVLDNADIKYSIRTEKNKEHKVLLADKIDCQVSNISNDPKHLINNPELKLELIGKAYTKSDIKISAKMDQRNNVDNGKLSFDLTNLSLKEVSSVLKPIIHKKLGDGKLESLHIAINKKNKIFDGYASIKGLEITDLAMSDKKIKPDLLSAKINDLSVDFKKNGNDPNAQTSISSIEFVKPEIKIRTFTDKNKKPKKQMENKPFFAPLANKADLIIDKFLIKQAQFELFSDEETQSITAVKNTNLSAKGIRLYPNKKGSKVPLSIEDLELEVNGIGAVNIPKMNMSLGSIHYSLKQEKLAISNFKMKNKKTLVELYEGEKFRKPWFDISVPNIDVFFSLDDLINTNPHIRKIDINGTKFLFEFDFKLAINPKIKPLFVDMIKLPTFPYTVDNVAIDNSDVTIYMQENSPLRGGYLIFNDINGTIQNISNDPKVIEKEPNTLIDVKTLLWGEGQGHILGEISLSDPNKFFNLKGSVDTMDMSAANTLIKDVFNMSILSGRLNQAVFDIDFNEKNANGTVQFDYEDLKVTMYKGKHAVKVNTDTMTTVPVEKREKLNSSFMMKSIVNGLIKKDNIPSKGNYVIGSSTYVREPDKPVFRYFWYSLAAGMIETIEGGLLRSVLNIGKGSEKNETVKKENNKKQKEEKKAKKENEKKLKRSNKDDSDNNNT